jgi:hypothetical protein
MIRRLNRPLVGLAMMLALIPTLSLLLAGSAFAGGGRWSA